MREGRCCNAGIFSSTCLSGSRLSWPKLAKARSGLVPTFHRAEEKLAASFGSYSSPRLLDATQESRFSPLTVRGCFVVDPVEVANLQTGVWERRDSCELRAWRFVDVNDLVFCGVYAQPLSL